MHEGTKKKFFINVSEAIPASCISSLQQKRSRDVTGGFQVQFPFRKQPPRSVCGQLPPHAWPWLSRGSPAVPVPGTHRNAATRQGGSTGPCLGAGMGYHSPHHHKSITALPAHGGDSTARKLWICVLAKLKG